MVAVPEVSSVRDADRIVGLLEAAGLRKNQLIINRIRPRMVKRGDMMDIEDMIDILSVDLLGVVPEDETVIVSTNKGEPVVIIPGSRAGEAYRRIARRLNGEEYPCCLLTIRKACGSIPKNVQTGIQIKGRGFVRILKQAFWRDRDRIGSKHVAKERLRLVLVHDRVNSCPQLLEALKGT